MYPQDIPFIIDGTCGGQPEKDLAVTSIPTPVSGTAGTPQSVTINIANYGTAAQSVFNCTYQVTPGGALVTEAYTGPAIPGNGTGSYTFTTTINPAAGNYSIQGCVVLAGDANPANNCAAKNFSLLPSFACNWTIELWDTYGDGWNGAQMDVVVDTYTLLDNITLASGYGPATFTFGTNTGSAIDLWFHTAGSYPTEAYYKVYDAYGVLVYTNPTNPPPTHVYLTGSCVPPACPPPTNLGVYKYYCHFSRNSPGLQIQAFPM